MKRMLLSGIAVLFAMTTFVGAQELNCVVSINTTQIQGTNKEDVFNTLETAIREFMNNTVWTNNVFEVNERIECNLLFNITKEVTAGVYKGTLNVQSRRPVYASSYNSVMLNYVDEEIQFKYTQYDPLVFSETSHLSNLTSILAYYAYVIIGLDYDSFSLDGGTPYFQKAEKIVNNAQSSADPGWKAFESRGRKNRYWLVNNILDEGYEPLRKFNYTYHRLGLDILDNSVDKGRRVIIDALTELERFYNNKPDPFMHYFQVVLDSKADEIIQVFSQAPAEDKKKVYNLMVKFDPANSAKYAPLKET
jgi:hypothetical protein